MRNFTNSAEFDDTLPLGEGTLEASFRVKSERGGQTLGLHAKTGFQSPFTQGKRIVKFGGIRKISHAEAVQPVERARAALPGNHHVHVKFLGVHAESITEGRAAGLEPRKVLCSSPSEVNRYTLTARLR